MLPALSQRHTPVCFALILLLSPFPTAAVGFRLPSQSAEAVGRGNAFAATADNPSAIYYNPAGITQLEGQNLEAGLYTIAVDSSFRSPAGVEKDTAFELQSVPQLYYTYSKKPVAFGVGVYAPYGLGLQWKDSTGFRTLALEGRLTYATISPVMALEITPTLSLAVGPTLNFSKIRLRQGIATAGDEFTFRGQGFDAGFESGLRWQPHPQWAFGATFHSATEINFKGSSEAFPYSSVEHTEARAPFPQFIIAGVSYRPTTNWNIEVNVDWTDWSKLQTIEFQKASGNTPFLFNWNSSFMYSLGATRFFHNGYFVSAGYFFAENSTSERNFNPIVPDTNQHVGSIGVGHKGTRWGWAATYQLLTGPWRKIQNTDSISLAGETPVGQYRFFNNAINVSVDYHF